jgi:hypothetical protein
MTGIEILAALVVGIPIGVFLWFVVEGFHQIHIEKKKKG